jgi:hypothetical protein
MVGWEVNNELRVHSSICLAGLRKVMLNRNQDSLTPDWDSNPIPHEQEAGMPLTQLVILLASKLVIQVIS